MPVRPGLLRPFGRKLVCPVFATPLRRTAALSSARLRHFRGARNESRWNASSHSRSDAAAPPPSRIQGASGVTPLPRRRRRHPASGELQSGDVRRPSRRPGPARRLPAERATPPPNSNFKVLSGNRIAVLAPVPNHAAYKITEEESPRPTDRVYFNYNFYNDVTRLTPGVGALRPAPRDTWF